MEIKKKAWESFINVMDFESDDTNFKVKFNILTKKYGQAYIDYCRTMWSINEGVLSEEEFRKMNGDMPETFFNKNIKRVV